MYGVQMQQFTSLVNWTDEAAWEVAKQSFKGGTTGGRILIRDASSEGFRERNKDKTAANLWQYYR
jgi:hypothetical protein